jgi:hypothetical protein
LIALPLLTIFFIPLKFKDQVILLHCIVVFALWLCIEIPPPFSVLNLESDIPIFFSRIKLGRIKRPLGPSLFIFHMNKRQFAYHPYTALSPSGNQPKNHLVSQHGQSLTIQWQLATPGQSAKKFKSTAISRSAISREDS